MAKIIIQSNGDDSFKYKKDYFTEMEVKPKNYELRKIYRSTDPGDFHVQARHVYQNEILFDEPIDNISVDGTVYVTYEALSGVLTPILFKKGGGTGGGGTGRFANDIPVSLSGGKTVGKYVDGTLIPAAGKTYEEVLNMIANETKDASIVAPSFGFSKSDSSSLLEVGTNYTTNITASYNPGAIYGKMVGGVWQTANTAANKQADRAGALVSFNIDGTVYTDLTNPKTVSVSKTIANGNNNIAGSVTFAAGTAKPKRSDGTEYDNAYNSPLTLSANINIAGQMPYFYGVINDNQNVNDVSLSALTKAVANSSGTVSIPYSNVVGKKLVIVIPQASVVKTKWYVNALNNGNIGNVGDLFPVVVNKNYSSPDGLWSNQAYRVYVSTTTSINTTIQLQN